MNKTIRNNVLENNFSLFENNKTFHTFKDEQIFTSDSIKELIYQNVLYNSKKSFLYNFNFFDIDSKTNSYILNKLNNIPSKPIKLSQDNEDEIQIPILQNNIEYVENSIHTVQYKTTDQSGIFTGTQLSINEKKEIDIYNTKKRNKYVHGFLEKEIRKASYRFV